jgi:hypothetical protein
VNPLEDPFSEAG